MFEEELKLQKESSFVIPLIPIVVLIALIVVGIGWWVVPRRGLSQQEAAGLVSAYLQAQGPATVHFHVGTLVPSVDEKIRDPHYRLLEKAGILKLGSAKDDAVKVSFAPDGERRLGAIPGLVKTNNSDGSMGYTVPLAERRLVGIPKVTMSGRDLAYVQFTWQWAPNELGDAFDIAGPQVQSFTTWDRTTLIQKYGAAFYHAQPAQETLAFVRADKGWKLASE
jgi:hypothetical protein